MKLKISNLSKSFGSKELFCNLNLEMQSGEIFALIGPNGAGKTTLMRMILGWDTNYQGRIELPKDARLGYSPEMPFFPRDLTGRQVLEFFMEARGMKRAKRRMESEYLMEVVGLEAENLTKVAKYSKGMRQRLAVAQSLIGDPNIILLDEPSAGLDFFGQQQMQVLIQSLKAQEKMIILNSHLLYDVERIADAGYVFMDAERGRIFQRSEFQVQSLAEIFIQMGQEGITHASYD